MVSGVLLNFSQFYSPGFELQHSLHHKLENYLESVEDWSNFAEVAVVDNWRAALVLFDSADKADMDGFDFHVEKRYAIVIGPAKHTLLPCCDGL